MIYNLRSFPITYCLLLLSGASPFVWGADAAQPSAEQVAKQLANPNATVGSLTNTIDYIQYDGDLPGANDESAWKYTFQPSLPYPLDESTNLFFRPQVPLFLDQPLATVVEQPFTTGNHSLEFDNTGLELGDIGFDLALGKSMPSGLVVGGGLVGTLPTATDEDVGLDQYLLGPEAFIAKLAPWGVVGVLLTHQWDIAGDDDFDTNVTGGQYFYTYNLEDAWQVQAQPTFSYNHEAASDDALTFPLGIGLSKTVLLNARPWKFALQYWHYVESNDRFGPDFQLRLSITPVVPLPW